MRQVRLAQGENMRRVQRLFLVTDSAAADLRKLLADYPDMAVAFAPVAQTNALSPLFSIEGTPMKGSNRVYLVDPLGNLMMYYRPDSDPQGMIRDLERLLKYSQVG
jgi:cytochrome oxidase Cu insertion factor (SCO1/SenC/PrrC family)